MSSLPIRNTPNSILMVGTFFSNVPGTCSVSEEMAERLTSCGWAVFTTSARRTRLTRLMDMVATTWSKRGNYRLAHVSVYSGSAFVWAEVVCWVLRRIGRPYVLTLHGGNLPAFSRNRPARVRRLLRSASSVTTPSAYLLEQMRLYRPDLQLVYNGVDLAACEFSLRKAPRPKLIWVRAFHNIYNPVLAAEVVARLAVEFPGIELIMLGPDKQDGSLELFRQAVLRLGLEDRVSIIGGVPKKDVPGWLKRADVFLNTSDVDNAPVSVLEAFACGLVVVSTRVGGIPYLLKDGQNGLMVPPGDADSMTKAVRRVLTEPGLSETLSRNARSDAASFDWNVVMSQWQHLLTSTVS